jgi:Ser/Thr protein kinase RdoA (MazF antagonist)
VSRRAWTSTDALPLLRAAAAALGLPSVEPRILRLGTNATARVADVVVRVAPAGREREAVVAEVAVARHAGAAGVPIVEPLGEPMLVGADPPPEGRSPEPEEGQPGRASERGGASGGHWVTTWRWIPHDPDAPVGGAAFGALLRRFHDGTADLAGPDAVALGPWRQPAIIDGWLAGLDDHPAVDDDERALLHRLRDARLAAVAGWEREAVVVHGDAHPGNVLLGPEGAVLLDLDLVARGPRAWDLAPAALHARRYAGGSPAWWDAAREAYGPPRDPREDAFVDLRELASALWLVAAQPRTSRAARDPEVDARLAALRGDADAPRWAAG